MPRFTLVALCLVFTVPITAQSRSITRLDGSTITTEQAETLAHAELEKAHVMGAQLAVLNHGQVVWTYAFGLRDAGKQLPMTPDTNIWAASLTKGVFATWVMRLVQEHRLELDRPVAAMLPQPLDSYEPYKNSASELVKDLQWSHATPRMLLDHTSGLSNLANLTEPDKKMRLHFAPGSRYAYSGDGLNLLQFVIEQTVIHEPLEAAMQRDVFTPLGMKHSGMVWRDDFAENMALRYGDDGRYVATTRRMEARAAGSMATTVNDLVLYLEALLGGKLLAAKTQSQMFSPQVRIPFAHQFPTLSTEQGSEGAQVGLAYGLGWGLLTKTKFGPVYFKEGHGDGAQNYIICFERGKTCMVLLTNSDNGELAFRPLLEKLIGDTVTPWEWEAYTPQAIERSREQARGK